MKNNKKISTLLLSLVFLMTGNSCGSSIEEVSDAYHDETYNPMGKYEETVKIKGVMEKLAHNDSRVPSNITPDNQKFMTLIKEELNIEFEYMWKVSSSQYDSKLTGTILSGDYPDILKVTASQYSQFKDDEILKDLSEAYKYASPETKKYLERDPNVIENLKDSDGKIYAIPQYNDPLREVPVMYIRQDWLDDCKLTYPTTPEELKNVLKAFKEQKGATAGLALNKSYKGSSYTIDRYMQMFGSNPFTWVTSNGNLEASEITNETKAAIKYLSDLYSEGLLAPDFASSDAAGVEANLKTGKTGVIFGPWWQYEYPLASYLKTQNWASYPIPLAEGAKVIIPRESIESYYVVMKTCAYPEALMKMINAYIEYDGKEKAKPEDGYVWSWVPTQYHDPNDINIQFETINAQLESDPTAQGEAPEEWTSHAKKLWAAIPDYLTWKEDHGAVKYQENMFANIIGRVNKDGAWAAIRATKEANNIQYDEFYGLPTENQDLYGGQLSTICETFLTKAILKEVNIDTEWEGYVNQWKSSGGNKVTSDVNAWYTDHK